MKVLAIFPPLDDPNPGGVQAAARIAWQALEKFADAALLEVSAARRWQAVRRGRQQHAGHDVALFWHLDLLRLAPLLPGRARRAVFLHGIEAWRRPDPLTHLLLRGTHLIANSHYTAQRARPYVRGRSTQIAELGWGDGNSEMRAPGEPPAAVMIGRLDRGERYKGHHEVIAAWPTVLRRLPDAQLWIVGDGNLRDELERTVAAQHLDHAIRFFGRVADAEKAMLLGAARCLVLPSRGEGFGLVYLEAMRAGRPCLVGTDAGRDVVEPPEAGLSVDPSDSAQLADAIARLLTLDGEWQRMAAAARRRHAAHFTAAHFQARLLAALRQLR